MATTPAYRKAGQGTGLWLVFTLLGLAGLHAVIFWMISIKLDRQIGWWVLPIAIAPLLLGLATGSVLVAHLDRKRLGRLAGRIERLGFRTVMKPPEAERAQFAAPIAHLLPGYGLKHGAAGIRWFAEEQTATAKILLFEHEYVTGAGRPGFTATRCSRGRRGTRICARRPASPMRRGFSWPDTGGRCAASTATAP